MVHGRIMSVDEVVAKIDAIDQEAVLKVAKRLFSSQPTLAAIGPLAKVASYEAVRSGLVL
jgi:predicted Zn-dependent peptidase